MIRNYQNSYLVLESAIFPCNLTSNFTLDCSNLALSAVPKNIPNTTLQLNLSHNSLKLIDEDAFDDCCTNLKVLHLSHNEISTLNRRHFEKLKNLEVIFLDSNKITELAADTFQSLTKLRRLNLNRNSIVLQGSFLFQSSLEELNLDYCEIDEIPDRMFVNMTQLEILSLEGNPIDENLDTSAFESLTNLLKLRIPNLSPSTTYQICDKLTAIDTINFDTHNISCTVLSDDGSFDESIISNDPIELPKVQLLTPHTTRKPTTTQAPTTASSSIPSTILPAVNETSTNVVQPQIIETSDGDATNKTKINTETASIDIDNETIKFILVGESSVDEF